MTAPVLAYKKFYVVNPFEQYNYIKNPTFASPDFVEDWTAYGDGYTIEETGDEQRFGAYSMKVNTANVILGGVNYQNLSVTKGVTYAFSCYIKGTAGQSMSILVTTASGSAKVTTNFKATGYWQRVEATFTATETKTDYKAYIRRAATASTAPFYVDGCQFEHWKMTTFFDGYSPGCRWTGAPRNSTSYRSAQTGLGGELVDLDDYCKVVQVTGLGHGNWNQILTKMTSGGDMYQTHIRKSRNFSIIVDFLGNSLSEIEANRAAVIDLLRPDKLSNRKVDEQFGINWGADYRGHEQRVIRYQGVDVNGNEATNPVDIVCVPLSASMVDTPDLPTYQRAILNFTIPSGLLQGAYNEGAELDWVADFPAEFIVKRDANGNWVKWTGSAYASLITGLNGTVKCMAEGPDGKIYAGGSFTNAGTIPAADYLARWNPITEAWKAVLTLDTQVSSIAFDAAGGIAIGFLPPPGGYGDKMVGHWDGTTFTVLQNTGSYNISPRYDSVDCLAYDTNGLLWVGGEYNLTSVTARGLGYRNGNNITWINPSPKTIKCMVWSPDGKKLYVGGEFTNATGSGGDYLAYYDKTDGAFHKVGGVELNGAVYSLAFGANGYLYAGGAFTNAGGIANADYIARWNGASWESLGSGADATVRNIVVNSGKVYASGSFTAAGGLTLTDRVAVWSNGAWQPLDIDLPGTAIIYSILPASDGSLYVGGAFTTAGTAGTPKAKCGIVSDRILAIGVASASANTYPYIQVRGTGTLQAITNYTTGKSVRFDGLTLQAGEWIGLNFDPLNLKFRGGWDGRGNLMRYVIPGSDYGDFYLKPGSNSLSLFMTEATTDSGATIVWSPKFWGLDGALL